MKSAIVSLGEKREYANNFLSGKLRFSRRSIHEIGIVHADVPVTVYTLGFSGDEICGFSEKKLGRIMKKCISALLSHGVMSVYLTDEVIEYVGRDYFSGHFRLPDGRRIFDALLCEIIHSCPECEKMPLPDAEIGIWQYCFDERGYNILQRVCDCFKYITVFTKSDTAARMYANRLYEAAGISVKVSHKTSHLNKCDVAVLADRLDSPITNENTLIIDESGLYPYRCRNKAEFLLPFGFNALMGYFGDADCRCVDFLFDACGIVMSKNSDINALLESIGCSFKKIIYKPHKNIDNT